MENADSKLGEELHKLQAALSELNVEALHADSGLLSRPTAGPREGDVGMPLYLGITKQLQDTLGILKLGEHVALTAISGTQPQRFVIHLLSGVIDDDTFLENAAKGSYQAFAIDAQAAQQIVKTQLIDDQSISLPSGNISSEQPYAIVSPEKLNGTELPTTLRIADYDAYPKTLRTGRKGNPGGWEAANTKGLPIVVVPNGVALLLGSSLGSTTHLPGELGKTIADGTNGFLRLPNGDLQEVFFVGARDKLGLPSELQESLQLSPGKECHLKVSVGTSELIIENSLEHIQIEAHDRIQNV